MRSVETEPLATCPECDGDSLYYEKEQHEVEKGPLFAVNVRPDVGRDPTPVIDYKSDISYTLSSDEERVECQDCDAIWPSWDDFLVCFLAENHDEECIL